MIGVSDNEIMTRKEYLKSKKKNHPLLSLITPIVLLTVIIVLGVYIWKQLDVYNSVTAITNKVIEESALIKTDKMYFMGQSYTSSDDKIMYLYNAMDESRKEIVNGRNFSKIQVDSNFIYGILDNNLYKISILTEEKDVVCEGNVFDYIIQGADIYVYKQSKEDVSINGLYKKIEEEFIKIVDGTIYQLISDGKNIYVVMAGDTAKTLYRLDMDGNNKEALTTQVIVSYITQDESNIYFSNKTDNGKIYKLNKESKEITQVSNKSVNMGTDEKYINGNRLMAVYNNILIFINVEDENKIYTVNVDTTEEKNVTEKAAKLIHLKKATLYFMIEGDIAVYKYNIETGVTEKLTSARTEEIICIN